MTLRTFLLCVPILLNLIPNTVQSPLQGWADRGNGLARRMYLIAQDPLHPTEAYASIVETRSFISSSLVPTQTNPPALLLTERAALHPRETQTEVASSTTVSPLILHRRHAEAASISTSTTSPLIIGTNYNPTMTSTISTLILARETGAASSSTYCGWAACPPSSTSTSPPPIPTKVDPKCNVQGYASSNFQQNYLWRNTTAQDVLSCQLQCMYTSQCQSYSYEPASVSNGTNCVFYHGTFDATNLFVILDSGSPWRFSDKYPVDGSNFCYGEHTL